MKNIIFIILILISKYSLSNIKSYKDKIYAVIDNEIILESEINKLYKTKYNISKCDLLKDLIINKIILSIARQNNIKTSDEEINNEINNKISEIKSMFPNKEDLFKELKITSMEQLKKMIKNDIKNNIIINKQRNEIIKNISLSPLEIEQFYKKNINKLNNIYPFYTIQEIALKVKLDKNKELENINNLKDIIKDIKAGNSSFSTNAILYSEDEESSNRGGLYLNILKGSIIKDFENKILNLKKGQISQPFKTKYGYHIAILEKVKNNKITFRHILKKHKYEGNKIEKLQKICKMLENKDISFEDAIKKYSENTITKKNNGLLYNKNNLSYKFNFNELPTYLKSNINLDNNLNYYIQDNPDEENFIKLFLIIKNKQKNKLNYKEDFMFIRELALKQKINEKINEWIKDIDVNILLKGNECKINF